MLTSLAAQRICRDNSHGCTFGTWLSTCGGPFPVGRAEGLGVNGDPGWELCRWSLGDSPRGWRGRGHRVCREQRSQGQTGPHLPSHLWSLHPSCTALLLLPPHFPASYLLQPLLLVLTSLLSHLLQPSPSHWSLHIGPPASHPTFSYPPIRLPARSAPSHLYVPQHLITPPSQAPWSH